MRPQPARGVAARRWWPPVRAAALVAAGAALVAGAAQAGPGGPDPTTELSTLLDLPVAGPAAGQVSAPTAGERLAHSVVLGCAGVAADDLDRPVGVAAAAAPERALPTAPAAVGRVVLTGAGQGSIRSRDAVLTGDLEGRESAVLTGEDGMAPGLAGVQWHLDPREQHRGLTVASCPAPRQEAWLVAGGGQPGRSEHVVLLNPGANPLTADVAVLGAGGRVATVGGRGVVVPAGGRVELLVDALAPGVGSPVVQVTAEGGVLVAALSDRWLDGTTDRGVEVTTPAAPPALEQLVPVLAGSAAGERVTTTLRLAAPGEEPAVAQLRELGEDGAYRPVPDVVRVPAGGTVDVTLSGLLGGTSALQVVADVPVVAAVQVTTEGAARTVGDVTGSTAAPGDAAAVTAVPGDTAEVTTVPGDAATATAAPGDAAVQTSGPDPDDPGAVTELVWVPAATPVTGLAGTPLPPVDGLEHRLVLSAVPGGSAEVLTRTGDEVSTRTVTIAPGGSTVVELEAGTESVWLRPLEGPVAAALLSTGADAAGPFAAAAVLEELAVERDVVAVRPWRP